MEPLGLWDPFEAAQGHFLTDQVIPLVVGAFGDVNDALEKVLKLSGKGGRQQTDSQFRHLFNTDRNGGELFESCTSNSDEP
jgi:hypothetical protein